MGGFLAMDDVLLLDICKGFEWRLRIDKRVNRNYTAFMIGFVEHPREESIKNWNGYHFAANVQTKLRQLGVYISSSYTDFRKYGRETSNVPIAKSNPNSTWKNGDTFTLKIDFESRTIELFYNDESVGILYENIPKVLVPAICVYTDIEISCIAYDYIQNFGCESGSLRIASKKLCASFSSL